MTSKTVSNLSYLRQSLDSVLKFIETSKPDAQAEGAGREMALVQTKIEEARMWAGKGLSHFETGFKLSDIAGQEETFTKELNKVAPVAKENTVQSPVQA